MLMRIADHNGYNESLYFNTVLILVTTAAFWLWARETSSRIVKVQPAATVADAADA